MLPTVKTLLELHALKNHEEGEIIKVLETGQYYIFHNGEWIIYVAQDDETLKGTIDSGLDLYSLNKMIIKDMKNYSKEDILEAKKLVKEFISKDDLSHAYMLLCHELRYYTVFLKDKEHYQDKMEDVFIECIENLGTIKSISLSDDMAIEVWFVHHETEEPFVAYLFNYDEGVILCH